MCMYICGESMWALTVHVFGQPQREMTSSGAELGGHHVEHACNLVPLDHHSVEEFPSLCE
uniref:Uncharacterized protein n=1 Tax=Physcomitrium patens TaxID=3218 RepID=A0A2K1K7E9_PHYPA|nr:hypothetical protein PHYPA_011591 [Physcomitrium patens]